jgi:hypothetical protein
MLSRPGRYRRLEHLRTLDPTTDYHEIYRTTALYEFPFDVRMGLLLAFWRTFAVPSIAEVLDGTGEMAGRTARRADDTGILMYELIDHGLDHPRGRTATRRLNRIHHRFAITNDEYRYVLGTFVVVALRWLDRYAWRPVCCHERTAMLCFYTELGRRMNIRDIPPTLADYERFFDDFEATHLAYTPAAARLMAATKGLLTGVPRPLARTGPAIVDALLDPPLRAATGTAPPGRFTRTALAGTLSARAVVLRHLARPRRRSVLADGIRTTTYPDGYDLATVGPDGTRPDPRDSAPARSPHDPVTS